MTESCIVPDGESWRLLESPALTSTRSGQNTSLLARQVPQCFTEFGVAVPIQNRAPEGFEWIMGHTEAFRQQKLVDGLRWTKRSGYVRLVIVWNLDYDGAWSDPNAPYALRREGWESIALNALARVLLER